MDHPAFMAAMRVEGHQPGDNEAGRVVGLMVHVATERATKWFLRGPGRRDDGRARRVCFHNSHRVPDNGEGHMSNLGIATWFDRAIEGNRTPVSSAANPRSPARIIRRP